MYLGVMLQIQRLNVPTLLHFQKIIKLQFINIKLFEC